MSTRTSFRAFLVFTTCLLFAAAATPEAKAAEPARPAGVYLHVEIDYMLKQAKLSGAPAPQQHTYVTNTLRQLLNTRALEGVTVGEQWSALEPNPPASPDCSNCDWGYLDEISDLAKSLGKSVQYIVTPGFDAPQWLKDKLAPCDNLFAASGGGSAAGRSTTKNVADNNSTRKKGGKNKPDTSANTVSDKGSNGKGAGGESTSPGPDCGSVQFIDFPEQQRAQKDPNGKTYTLPLPWDSRYQTEWWNFLGALSHHLKNRPNVVAVAIAGPIAASDEIILPTTAYGAKTQVGGVDADNAWSTLISNYDKGPGHPQYPSKSDQIFVDLWKTTIEKYESIFSGLTIFLGPDAGNYLPTFKLNGPPIQKGDSTLYAVECRAAKQFTFSCQAKTEIISAFNSAKGPNQKATQVGGMTAASLPDPGNIGVAGVKLLTAPYPSLWHEQQAIGGAEFDHSVSNLKDDEGCPADDPKCNKPQNANMTPERAAANVLKVFFHNTKVGKNYGDPQAGTETMNYLEVPMDDIVYMEHYLKQHGCTAPPGQTSLFQQLYAANNELLVMAGEKPQLADACSPPPKPPVKPPVQTK